MTIPTKFYTVVPEDTSLTYTSERFTDPILAAREALKQTLNNSSQFIIMTSTSVIEYPLTDTEVTATEEPIP